MEERERETERDEEYGYHFLKTNKHMVEEQRESLVQVILCRKKYHDIYNAPSMQKIVICSIHATAIPFRTPHNPGNAEPAQREGKRCSCNLI